MGRVHVGSFIFGSNENGLVIDIVATTRRHTPLPPYLFIVVMTVKFNDAHKNGSTRIEGQRVSGTETDEAVYADDTICIAQTTAAMNRLLNSIREKAGIIQQSTVKFASCEHAPNTNEVKYLGCLLNNREKYKHENTNVR